MGAPSLRTGLNTAQPMNFAKDRFGRLLGVNGLDRGLVWDGKSASSELLGVDAPTVAATMTTPGGGGATAGSYDCYYRFVDKGEGIYAPSNLSPVATTTAADSDMFVWSSLSTSSQSRVDTVELWRTTSGVTSKLHRVASIPYSGSITSSSQVGGFATFVVPAGHGLVVGSKVLASAVTYTVTGKTATTITTNVGSAGPGASTWSLSGFTTSDTATDTALNDYSGDDVMRLVKPNGDPNANRFTPPPNWKSVVVMFQDRALYMADVEYATGTVALTADSVTATGSGTAWTTEMAGRYLHVVGATKPLLISSVGSATSITLSKAAPESVTAGALYAIRPAAGERNVVYFSEADDAEAVPSTNQIIIQENIRDEDEIVGAIPYGNSCIIAKEHTLYRLNYFAQPIIDAKVSLFAFRGLFNHRCWDILDGILYGMDEDGCWTGAGGSPQDISGPIADYFRDGTISLTNKKWFHVQADPVEGLVYFYVQFAGDTGTRPKRALVWETVANQWMMPDLYLQEVGAAVKLPVSGTRRMVTGWENDQVRIVNEGTLDFTAGSGTVRGTATSSGSTTLTDSGATFPTDCKHATVSIVNGTGKGQIRYITTRNSATQITVDTAWTTNPDTTSTYQIGAIEWAIKTGRFTFSEVDRHNPQALRVDFWPTSGAAQFDMRRYLGHSTSAETMSIDLQGDMERGLTGEIGSTDIVKQMKLATTSNQNEPGSTRIEFGGRTPSGEGRPQLWVAFQLAGFQGADAQVFSAMRVEGAK